MNERFPHKIEFYRPRISSGVPVLDSDGNPAFDRIILHVADTVDGEIIRIDGEIQTHEEDYVNFGYRVETNSIAGDVATDRVKIHTPVFTDELVMGDKAVVTDYEGQREYRVVNKAAYNLGTNILIEEVKN